MKAFFINFWKVMMFLSFITMGFSIISIPFIEMESINNVYTNEIYSTNHYVDDFYTHNLISDFWDTLKNIINFLFDKLYIDVQVTQFQTFISVFVLSLVFGFIFRLIVKRMEY